MENKNVLLVVNPISGSMDKTDIIGLVKTQTDKLGAKLEIFQTTGKNDHFNLEKIIENIDPYRIIVAGGDGTIKIVAEALKDKKIPLGIISAGSANGLAFNLHLPDTIEESIHVALQDNFIEMDIISINGEYCLHMSDLGLNAELIENFEHSSIRGKFGYLLQTIPTLAQSEYPFKFKIEANNEIVEKEGILLAIANANSYGTGATVNPDGKLDDGFFEILILKNLNMFQILNTLRNETVLDPDFIEVISTKEATISCLSKVAFQIDGEFIGKRDLVNARILEKKVKIAVPEIKIS